MNLLMFDICPRYLVKYP